MQFVWSDLIHRAKVYFDDHHEETDGFLLWSDWLNLGNVEYAQLYRRWIRTGLIGPAPTSTSFTGSTVSLTGVLALIGVAQDLGNGNFRVLESEQSLYGRAPFWDRTGPSSFWSASGSADNLTISLEPRDTSGSFVVRHLPTVPYATVDSATIDLPYGGDERLVLGIVRRAKVVESAASSVINSLILDADAELNFAANGKAMQDAPRVRRKARYPFGFAWETRPSFWSWY